ncbi:hypothetical protein [Metabacillus halosaccharovorans]|uniref:hypothetical protein n=1 Tax=Metabacillus halosaccharovorans TaxID=930124 RepID=UPI00203FBD02|nr:hypothetical protein [Metabacillus halosaccharovorans]MCM3444393.1 hypothetical protein [Metabacillus halosaccharovorans]
MELLTIFKEIASMYGLPFALFIALLVWVLYKNDQRESRYLTVIQTLSEDVKERLSKIEARIFDGGDKE